MLGHPSLCSVGNDADESLDMVSLVNTAWALMDNYRSCLKVIGDLEDRVTLCFNLYINSMLIN